MKKAIVILSILFFSGFTYANEPVFELELDQTFSQLDELESFIIANPELSLDEIKSQKSNLVDNVSFESNAILKTAKDMPLVGPFWWGCVLGVIGLVLVYIVTDKDKEQTKNALIGCVVGTLLFGGIWALSGSLTWF